MGRKTLGALEQSVMMVILALGEAAYGVAIRDELSRRTRREHSFGAVYTTLDRLAAKEFVVSWLGDPSPERGGRAKRYFRLTEAGQRIIEETIRAHQDLGSGLGVGKPVGFQG